MGWENREYNRDGSRPGAGSDGLRRLNDFFNKSFPIGTYLDIRVRIHILFFIFIAFELLTTQNGEYFWTLRWTGLLFFSVLLHEFGHCLGCRSVGGTANDILMWPLGGLAFCAAPRRPWPEFVTVICGPLVNVLLMAICYTALFVWMRDDIPVGFNPFDPWLGFVDGVQGLLADLFVVNYILLLFNVFLIFYPFDGGRLVQIGLWKWLGYRKSMVFATRFGMVGAVMVALYGLAMKNTLLMLIGVFGFITCYQQGTMLRQGGVEEEDEAWDVGLYNERDDQPQNQGFFARRREEKLAKRNQREREREMKIEQEVDRILIKIKDEGMHSLSEKEKKSLQRASEHKRRT